MTNDDRSPDKIFQPRTFASIRLASGKTQLEVAIAAGLNNRISVWQWENSDSDKEPKPDQAEKVAKYLGVDVNMFYQELSAEFRELFESNIEAFCISAFESDSDPDRVAQRMAIDIWKHMYPEPININVENNLPENPMASMVNKDEDTD